MAVALLRGQVAAEMPQVLVYSNRVANQSPGGTVAMPVSALRYEPVVDIQPRNLAEGQADVTLRGGIFETTGFVLGASTLTDPQTGHYLAEIPVAPTMLAPPEILTGADLALRVSNATTGAISYAWREIRTLGSAGVGFGEFGHARQEFYQGYSQELARTGRKLGVDLAVAHSRSNGSLPFGEHEFDRANVRFQLKGRSSQTDLFAGYQAKFFGWPNLYTPFNSNETENLQTVLFMVNHRSDFGDGRYLEAAAYHRRHKDDYAFNRFAPVGPVHPFQHTTRVRGATLGGRMGTGAVDVDFRAELLADEIASTSLTFGRYRSRSLAKLALVPEYAWIDGVGTKSRLRVGGTYDGSNRGDGSWSPVLEYSRDRRGQGGSRWHLGYARTTQVPSYTALNANPGAGLFRGNPGLGRGSTHNAELGLQATLVGWMGEAAVFWRRDDELVDWTFRRGVTARTANPVDLTTSGVELVARRTLGPFDLVLGYTALSKDADYRGALVDASFYALNYPRHRLTAALTVRLGRGVELRLDNVARLQAANWLRVTGGDRAVISTLGLDWRVPTLPALKVSLQVENVWDSAFQDVPAVPASGRQSSVSLSYTR